MEKYFFLDNENKQSGPVDASELARNGVTKDTLVWRKGMTDWQPAGSISELYGFIPPVVIEEVDAPPPTPRVTPTPVPRPVTQPAQQQEQQPVEDTYRDRIPQKPDNYLVWAILTTVFCCIPSGIVAIVYSAKVNELWNKKDYNGAISAASTAKTWCFVSLGLGLLTGIISFFGGLLEALALA